MRKRGAKFRHRNAMIPGLIAQSACPEYETRLRLAVASLRDGWMDEDQFNDLADTIDMLQIGLASYGKQKPDPGAVAAVEVCREAMYSIRDRYLSKGKFGATGEEMKAVQLLADVSLDFWNRRSGALFHFACEQLRVLRAEQHAKAKAEKEQQQQEQEQEQERKAA